MRVVWRYYRMLYVHTYTGPTSRPFAVALTQGNISRATTAPLGTPFKRPALSSVPTPRCADRRQRIDSHVLSLGISSPPAHLSVVIIATIATIAGAARQR